MTTPSKPPSLIKKVREGQYLVLDNIEKLQKIDTILQAAWDEYNEHGGCGCLFCHAIDAFKED